MNKISVVTITYNNYEELQATLNSISALSEIESVVVNGGNCKKTATFLESHNGVSKSEPDKGIADAFNKGISLSTSEAIVFLNSGDLLIDQNYYKDALKYFNNHPEISFIHSNIIYKDSIAGKIPLRHKKKSLGRGMPYFHQTLIVRRDVFDKIGNFNIDKKIGMDFDFIVRMLKHNYKGKFFERETVLMDGTGVSSTSEYQGIKECFQSLKEYNMLTFENYIGIAKRITFYYIRTLTPKKTLSLIKKLKHQ